jgi:hypothetical protein
MAFNGVLMSWETAEMKYDFCAASCSAETAEDVAAAMLVNDDTYMTAAVKTQETMAVEERGATKIAPSNGPMREMCTTRAHKDFAGAISRNPPVTPLLNAMGSIMHQAVCSALPSGSRSSRRHSHMNKLRKRRATK